MCCDNSQTSIRDNLTIRQLYNQDFFAEKGNTWNACNFMSKTIRHGTCTNRESYDSRTLITLTAKKLDKFGSV